MIIKISFWFLISILLYTYVGYTVILFLVSLLSKQKNKNTPKTFDQPSVTFLIAAYNEKDSALEKVKNTFEANYPKEKIYQIWVTDGSTDGTENILKGIENVEVYHDPIRKGKTAALNRGMCFVKTPFTIFSDANTFISSESINLLIKGFENPKVGCVAGEKRITSDSTDNAVSSGEGAYWRYESLIKKLESESGSALSAAGELYAIRTELFKPIKDDVILDDFIISTNIIKEGFSIKYIPEAYASEKASLTITEEKKRKSRIAAGGFQVLFRYTYLLNVFRFPKLALQYISHKLLRWVFVPISIFIIPLLNVLILLNDSNPIYQITLSVQIIILVLAIIGSMFQNTKIRIKSFFLPYYLIMMNLSVIQGFWKYIRGNHNVIWEKSIRQT